MKSARHFREIKEIGKERENAEVQLQSLEREIEKEALEGKYKLTYLNPLNSIAVLSLRSLGFKVTEVRVAMDSPDQTSKAFEIDWALLE